jgi:hypothetical protein
MFFTGCLNLALALALAIFCQVFLPACAQPVQSSTTQLQNESLAPIRLAQGALNPPRAFLPTDITPVADDQGRALINPDVQFRLFQKLPRRMWFTQSTEVSQRLETNVFFTTQPNASDYVFRVMPNTSLGYNVFKYTSVYCNHFVIKDVFAKNYILTQPTTQSLSLGFRQDIPLGSRTNMQADFQARELWQAKHLRQGDLLPSITLTRVVSPKVVLFASALLQIRSQGFMHGPVREIDPFYTLGFLYRRGQWSFVVTDTLVNNFRRQNAIPPISNSLNIATIELSRPLSKKMPSLQGFIRAEPIWNWGAHGAPGLSGFDFRLFGGIRVSLNKPAYVASVSKLREQLKEMVESEQESQPLPPKSPAH